MDKQRIGFIGLGVMGTPMATHIARAGYALAVHDVQTARAEALASELEGVAIKPVP
jgi:3-hydroxyisobutyrate dehydrogenase-like beta-hydroxyacid dehydrogenase